MWSECEASGRYGEAELAVSRLRQLRAHEETQRGELLRCAQLAERLKLEERQLKETQEFYASWEKKVASFEQDAEDPRHIIAERHKRDHESFMQKAWEETAPRTCRWSRELTHLRKELDTLAKQRKYNEAEIASTPAPQVMV